ncbi:hypothetical protein Tco_0147976 [Tanacetum coccineum]
MPKSSSLKRNSSRSLGSSNSLISNKLFITQTSEITAGDSLLLMSKVICSVPTSKDIFFTENINPGVSSSKHSTFSTIPFGDCMGLLAISITILIGLRLPSPSRLNKEKCIILMLAPKSANALLTVVVPIVQGRMKLPGSFSLGGSSF